jgi:hypothetical protein
VGIKNNERIYYANIVKEDWPKNKNEWSKYKLLKNMFEASIMIINSLVGPIYFLVNTL